MGKKNQESINYKLIEGLCRVLGSLLNIHDNNITNVIDRLIGEIAVVNYNIETIRPNPINSLARLLYYIVNTEEFIPKDIETIVLSFRSLEVMSRNMQITLKFVLKAKQYIKSNNTDALEGENILSEINEFLQEMYFDHTHTLGSSNDSSYTEATATISTTETYNTETGIDNSGRTRTSTIASTSSLPIEIPITPTSSPSYSFASVPTYASIVEQTHAINATYQHTDSTENLYPPAVHYERYAMTSTPQELAVLGLVFDYQLSGNSYEK